MYRLLGVDYHWQDYAVHFLSVVAEGGEQPTVIGNIVADLAAGADSVEVYAVELQPVAVWMLACKGGLQFFVLVDAPLLHIDHHHFAGTQTPFLADFRWLEGEHACLRGENHSVVLGDEVAGRT